MTDHAPPRVYVTGRVPDPVAVALDRDFALVDRPDGADGILSLITTVVDDEYLRLAGPQLKVVANYGVGTSNIDLDAARRRGVAVTNTPDVVTRATAEVAVALMLALLRRVAEGDRLIRAGTSWSFALDFMLGESLDGKTVAILGPGRIGRETARLVEAFGAHAALVGRGEDLGSVLERADVVSVHCPLTPATHHLIDATALARMRPSAVLVNTARGAVVDEAALVEALERGAIAGAALDVHEFEPDVSTALRSMENVVLTPHIGSATRQTREAMGMLAVDGLRAVLLEGRQPANTVV